MARNLEHWGELKSVLNCVMLTRLTPLVLLFRVPKWCTLGICPHSLLPTMYLWRITYFRRGICKITGAGDKAGRRIWRRLGMPGKSLLSWNSDTANKMSPYTFSNPTVTCWATSTQKDNHTSLKNKVNSRVPTANRSCPALSLNHTWTSAMANWLRSKPTALVQLE